MYQSVFLTFQLLVIILQMRTQGNSPKLLMGDSTTAGNQSQRVVTFNSVPRTERTVNKKYRELLNKVLYE